MSESLCRKVQPTHCILLHGRCCGNAFRNGKRKSVAAELEDKEKLILFKLDGTRILLSDCQAAIKTSPPEDAEVTGPMLSSWIQQPANTRKIELLSSLLAVYYSFNQKQTKTKQP